MLRTDQLGLLIFLHASDIRMAEQKLANHQTSMGIIAHGAKLHLTNALHGFLVIRPGGRRTTALGFDKIGHQVVFAGIQNRDGANIGVLVDTHAQGQICAPPQPA